METLHRVLQNGHTAVLFEGDTCDVLQWSAMLLETQNRKKTAHFIASCGGNRSFCCDSETFRSTADHQRYLP